MKHEELLDEKFQREWAKWVGENSKEPEAAEQKRKEREIFDKEELL